MHCIDFLLDVFSFFVFLVYIYIYMYIQGAPPIFRRPPLSCECLPKWCRHGLRCHALMHTSTLWGRAPGRLWRGFWGSLGVLGGGGWFFVWFHRGQNRPNMGPDSALFSSYRRKSLFISNVQKNLGVSMVFVHF